MTTVNEDILDTQYLLEERDGSLVRITLDMDGTEKTVSVEQRVCAGRDVMGIAKVGEAGRIMLLHNPYKTQFPVRVAWDLDDFERGHGKMNREYDMMFSELRF